MNGTEIKQLRKSLKLTQQKLAKRIGVTRQTVYNWEHDIFLPHPVFIKALNDLKETRRNNGNAR